MKTILDLEFLNKKDYYDEKQFFSDVCISVHFYLEENMTEHNSLGICGDYVNLYRKLGLPKESAIDLTIFNTVADYEFLEVRRHFKV